MEFMAHDIEWAKHITTEQALWGLGILAAVAAIGYILWRVFRRPDAYIYVPEGIPQSMWRYQQFKLTECKYCGSALHGNRHHVLPWAAQPELKDDPNNIVCLCRKCHEIVAHGGNWKRFNANLWETLKTPVWKDSNEYYRETHGGKDRTEVRK